MVFYGNEPTKYGVVMCPSCGAQLYNSSIHIGRLQMISPGTDKLAMEKGTALLVASHGVWCAPTGKSSAWLAEQASLQKLAREVKYKTCLASNP